MDHVSRLERLQGALEGLGVEALLVSNLVNVRYLVGFTGTNGQILVTPNGATFLTDPRYAARAATLVRGAEISVYPSRLTEALIPLLGTRVTRLGVEARTMTLFEAKDLEDRLERVAIAPTVGVVEAMRRKKDPDEASLVREAVALGDEAFGWLVDSLSPGATEREIAAGLEAKLKDLGAEGVSFPPIVGSGELSAHIHHTPSGRELQKGDLVLLDFGCRVEGYCSDLTRTVVLGSAADWQVEMYGLVLQAQRAGIGSVRAGASGRDVDTAARAVISNAGRGDQFGHGLGHGVGLEIHEDPRLNRISEDTLDQGDVVTVEPGVYAPGSGGVRIEDCLLVESEGSKVLSSAPKDDLIEL